MSELGIFIDESGVFEPINNENGFKDLYIVSFLFHEKSLSINDAVQDFEAFLVNNNFPQNIPIHTMPLIRQQKPYKNLDAEDRRKLFKHLFQFMRKLKLKHRVFVCDKSYCSAKHTIKNSLESFIEQMIFEKYEYFKKFDEIVIYYDSGQNYLTKTLRTAFASNLSNYRFKEDVFQGKYRLLQCADLVCSLELIKQRKQNNEHINAIEKFFKSDNKFNKNYKKVYDDLVL